MQRLVVLFSLISTISCSECAKLDTIAQDPDLTHVNICVLGNSYSNDSFCYVPFILKDYGITCNIHIYYRGSGSLHDLNEQWYEDNPYGLADIDGREHVRLHYSIDTRTDYKWNIENIMSANDIVSLHKWDIISLQQGGNRAKHIDTYYPYLTEIISKIDSICKYDYSLAWFMAYNSATENNNDGSISAQKIITETIPFDIVFPVATAVFIAQARSELNNLGDSNYKNMYCSDNIHLQEGLPCYLASLAIVQTLLDKYLPGTSVLGNQVRPTQEWIEHINAITPNGRSIGVTEENCCLAQKIAIIANLFNFSIYSDFK